MQKEQVISRQSMEMIQRICFTTEEKGRKSSEVGIKRVSTRLNIFQAAVQLLSTISVGEIR